MKNRFILLLLMLAVIGTGWVFGWNYLENQAEKAFSAALLKAGENGQRVQCDNRRSGGFPFRLSVSCDNPVYQKGDDLLIRAAGFKAESFVYRPLHQVVDFTSPADIQLGELGTLRLVWGKARLGSQLQPDGLSAASVKMENAHLHFVNPPVEMGNTAFHADLLTAHARRTGGEEPAHSVVLDLVSSGLSVLGTQYSLPPLSIQLSLLAFGIADVLDGAGPVFPLWISKGGEADIHALSLVSGHAQLVTKGWIKLDQDGFFNADLDVDGAHLLEFVEAMGPELVQIQSIARGLVAALEGLGENVTLGTQPAKRVKVTIRKGFVKIGLIPLGAIPQIDMSAL